MKAFQCSFSSVPGSGRQNRNLLFDPFYLFSSGDKERENRKCNILKSGGRTVIQFKSIVFTDPGKGCDFFRRELARIDRCNFSGFSAESGEKMREDFLCHADIGKLQTSADIKRTGCYIGINEQTAIRCNTLENSSCV